jgi:hypothetical protein
MVRGASGLATALVTALGVGCSTLGGVSDHLDDLRNPVTAEWAESETRVEQDDFRQTARLRGPDVEERIDRDGSYYRVHLRADTATNGAARFHVYVATHLEGEWRNLATARDQDGIPIAVHKVSRKERCLDDGCVFYEHIALPVTRTYLETRARDAIRLDVAGPGGAIHVVVPGVYVQGFLDRLARVEAARRGRPADRSAGTRASYCEAKFAGDPAARKFCREQARASYTRLGPARERARRDAFTPEAKRLDACMREHDGSLGIDWMMVEHCFGKAGSGSAPAAR